MHRRTVTAAAALVFFASLVGCTPSPDAITVDDYTGVWVAEGIDATVTLDDDWSMTIRGEDTDVLIPFVESVDTVWTPEVRIDDYLEQPFARWAYEDKERNQFYGGEMYFIGTKDEPRITLDAASPPNDRIEFVPAAAGQG